MINISRSFKYQRGFSLIEILIAMVITTVLGAGITTTIFQIFSENARTTKYMQVVQNVENAGYWINTDALVAHSITSTGNFPLVMQWQDCDFNESNNYQGNIYQVSYNLTGGKLLRSIRVNNGTPSQITVAEYINNDPTKTHYSFDILERLLTFTITANIGTTSEERIYRITLRSDVFSN